MWKKACWKCKTADFLLFEAIGPNGKNLEVYI